jgi:integrase
LRRAEVCRLDWSNVNLVERTITIGGKTAKKRSRRVVTINDACATWLALCAQPKGAVVTIAKQTLDQRIQNLATKAGLTAWKHNGLRHSFVTFHAAAHKDLPRTAYEAGNSVEVIKRHYDGLASEATAKRFWELRPAADAAEKIVPMQQAANG